MGKPPGSSAEASYVAVHTHARQRGGPVRTRLVPSSAEGSYIAKHYMCTARYVYGTAVFVYVLLSVLGECE